MNSQLSAVTRRRGELLAAIACQREELAEIGVRLQTPLAYAERGAAVARFLRSNWLLIAGVFAVLAIRRRGVVGAAGAVFRFWQRYRYFAAVAKKLLF